MPHMGSQERINRIEGTTEREKQVDGVPIYKKYLQSEFKRTQRF